MTSIQIVTPAARHSRRGNRVTADRYAKLLRPLGFRVRINETLDDRAAGAVIALHARKSAASIRLSRRRFPDRPVLLVLTGTDLYQDLKSSRPAKRSLELADRVVVLQEDAVRFLPKEHQRKARVIYQSCVPPVSIPLPLKSCFEVCVSGHLRIVKDPFRAEAASRLLPADSRIRITQIGAALTDSMRNQARRRMRINPRYRWLGEVPRWRARQVLARSRLLVVSSKLEGGANVISEAIAADVPVIASRVSGNIGMLGDDYPGYYELGDTRELADLLHRAAADGGVYEELRNVLRTRRPLIAPRRETRDWLRVLNEVSTTPAR